VARKGRNCAGYRRAVGLARAGRFDAIADVSVSDLNRRWARSKQGVDEMRTSVALAGVPSRGCLGPCLMSTTDGPSAEGAG